MVLLSLTASHHELDLDALERLSTGAGSVGRSVMGTPGGVGPRDLPVDRPVDLAAGLPADGPGRVAGAVVIATCNRFELYLDVEGPADGADAARPGADVLAATRTAAAVVARASGVDVAAAERSFTVRTGPDVAQHLFAVAAGLDSMVVGEREIAGQVRRSLEEAREEGTTSTTLELLFQTASRTSKRVATGTALGAAGRSVVALGLDLAAEELPPWRATRVVLIGTGSYAGASVAALRARGCEDVRVHSRSGRAELFAASHHVGTAPDLVEALADADLVVSCSGARGRRTPGVDGAETDLGHVLDAAAVVRARERAAEHAGEEAPVRPMVVLDLALHRDVDPRVADVEGVLLYDLATLKAHSPATGALVVGQAQEIVDAAARDFERTRLGRTVDAEVVALLDAAEEQVRAQVAERLAGRHPHDAPDAAEAEEVARAVRRDVHAALHEQIVAVRARALAAAQEAGQALVADAEAFVLQVEADEASRA